MEPEERTAYLKQIANLTTLVEDKGLAGVLDMLEEVCQDKIDESADGPWNTVIDSLRKAANEIELEEATWEHDRKNSWDGPMPILQKRPTR